MIAEFIGKSHSTRIFRGTLYNKGTKLIEMAADISKFMAELADYRK